MNKFIKGFAQTISVVIVSSSGIIMFGLIVGHLFGEETNFTMFLWSLLILILSIINSIALLIED